MLKLRYFLIGLLLGILLAWYLDAEQTASETKPVEIPPPESRQAKKPQTEKDALTEIDGIGSTYERALNALGILTFAQLAEQTPEDLASRISARVTVERIQREKWIEQAKQRSR